ncbi:MAG TPA: hypothetical protein DEH78_26475, partial [Solibacterales bacterium]|nr:hypothetical protein [Bryobacterales bacterium]
AARANSSSWRAGGGVFGGGDAGFELLLLTRRILGQAEGTFEGAEGEARRADAHEAIRFLAGLP